ncbi:MAG: VWA domain-containing protein [Sulfolobales archaeon]
MPHKRATAREESRNIVRTITAMLTLILVLSAIIPRTRSADLVDEAVRKYLTSDETVKEKRELRFGDIALTVYYLSSGHYIIYSHKHDSIVLGDEWHLNAHPEDLALQLVSLVAYDRYKPLENETKNKHYYAQLLLYANSACEAGVEAAKQELLIMVSIHLAAGMALLILVPPLSAISTFLILVSFTATLALDVFEFIEKFNLSPENSPKLFLALAMIPPYNDTALRGFHNALDKLTNKDFVNEIKKISDDVKTFTSSLKISSEMSRLAFAVAFALASKSPELISHVERVVGGELLEKAGAFFMFYERSPSEAIRSFKAFARLVRDVWAGKESPGKLGDFLASNIAGALGRFALSSVITIVRDYAVNLREDVREFIGFHTSHFLLVRELSGYMDYLLLELQRSLEPSTSSNSGELPTLDNVQKFFLHKYLLHLILEEYYEGTLKLSDGTLKKVPSQVLKLWGFDTESSTESIHKYLEEKKLEHGRAAESALAEILIYSSRVFEEFDNYRKDMAKRRGRAPTEAEGVKVFLVVDVSGSMVEQFKGARKIDAAKQAAKSFVSLTSKSDQVGLVKFSSKAELLSDLTSNKSVLYEAIDKLEPGGSTAIGDGLWLALDRLEAVTGLRVIILLTDGMHNAGTHTPEEAASRARSLGVQIYTLGFGEKDNINEERMKKVSEITGGRYFYSPSPEDLRRLYISLSQSISGLVAEKVVVDVIKAGELREFVTTVPTGTPYLGVKLSYSGSKLSVGLVSPSGYNLSFYESNVVYTEDVGYISVSVYNPEAGDWKIYVRGVEAPQQGLEYQMVLLKPSVTTSVDRLDLKLSVGESREAVVKLKAMTDLPSLEVSVLGDVKNIIASVEPQKVLNVKEGQEIPVKIRFTAPLSPSSWLHSGGLVVVAAASRVYIPISVTLDNLIALVTVNATRLKSGRAFEVLVRTFNIEGKAIEGASVTAAVGGKVYTFEDRGSGSYTLVLAGLDAGVHKLDINILKEGYLPITHHLSLTVRLLGDVNGDWRVDYRDIAILVSAYGSTIVQPGYIYDADLNEDGVVDYRDLAIIVANYGRKV